MRRRTVSWSHRRRKPRFPAGSEAMRADRGFTLIELCVVCLLLPIVVGAITYAFVFILTQRSAVAAKVLDATDAQVVSSNFETDVHSALQITTSSTASQCVASQDPTASAILGLSWDLDSAGTTYETTVSYVKEQQGSTYSLWRNYCVGGSLTATQTSEVAADIPSNQGPPSISYATGVNENASKGWVAAKGVTSVELSIISPGSGFPYALVGDPAVNASFASSGTATPTTDASCNFASPGTGLYASTLCFVDFSSFTMAGKPTPYCPGNGPGGTPNSEIDAAVTNTPFILKFCVEATGSPVGPSIIPTYTSPPTSEAFLGNNDFYGGIPGEPALYQTTEGGTENNCNSGFGCTYVYFTNIEVLDANDNAATGWSLVTGDAESTDDNEGMIWTTCPSVSNPGVDGKDELNWNPNNSACAASTSAPAFTLLPNSTSPDSPFGNACFAPDYPSSSVGWANFRLSGVQYTNIFTGAQSGTNTNTVQCFATVDSDKTGTVMISAPQPSNLTVFMQGSGLEALFLGLLLP
ncbi:MAG: type II secretion system protein [Acidimicrobiales bacterium]